MPLQSVIRKFRTNISLSAPEMESACAAFFDTGVADAERRDFLIALHDKGETADELVGAVRFLRGTCVPVAAAGNDVIDCCGTGGDQKGTMNISTAVAFVLAGGGVKVAKHGNRAVSSRSGSADVLTALGVATDLSPEAAEHSLKEVGIAFLSAPSYYPALKTVSAVRKSIPHRTIFNLLGPLLNPMRAKRQLLGVFDPKFVSPMAAALCALGSCAAIVMSSNDGLDEFSLSDQAFAIRLESGRTEEFVFDPWAASGYPRCSLDDLRGGTPEENAARLKKSLKGHSEPIDHVIHINSAWGFVVAGKASSFMDGLLLAQDSISSGRAYGKLEELAEFRG
jgi:anthranilate phosphoribosyltransferase